MKKPSEDIFIGIGSNMSGPKNTSPFETCEDALKVLEQLDLRIISKSNWYSSAPIPESSQPWYINGIISIRTSLTPKSLLDLLHKVEQMFGRTREYENSARTLDLDLIAYADIILGWKDVSKKRELIIPHPRMSERGFVLFPLKEIASNWHHPVSNKSINELILCLDPAQKVIRLDENS